MKDRHKPGENKVSRRAFLSTSLVAGAGAAVGTGIAAPAAASPEELTWDMEFDVVVVGAGATGLPAAIAARDAGASVLVVEANFDVGGKMMLSGGQIRLGGGNRLQQEYGVEDSEEQVFQDWIRHDSKYSRYSDRELIRVFADNNLAAFDFLEENGLTWFELAPPSQIESVARRATPPEWPVREEVVAHDQNRRGSGIVRTLEKSAREKGVEFLLEHRMNKLHREGYLEGRVIGLTAVKVDRYFNDLSETVNIRARKGVILATGGHSDNIDLRRVFDPRLTEEYQAHGTVWAYEKGDGEIQAMAVGASLWATANQTQEIGQAINKGRLGVENNYVRGYIKPESVAFFRARAMGLNVTDWQNVVLVRENGERFFDETKENYEYFAAAMAWSGDPERLNGGGPIWAIFDQDAVEREGWTVEPPHVDVEAGYFFQADTLEELAEKIIKNPYQWRPMPAEKLAETINTFNGYVEAGEDPDFGRPMAGANRVARGPFYAAWATPVIHDSLTGLRINTKAQVMDIFGKVIPGLYTGGETMGGFSLHGLGRAIVFGMIAGRECASEEV